MSTHSFDEIAENMSLLDQWEDRYRYIIELGNSLQPLDSEERNEQTKVPGCVSQVWLVTEVTAPTDGRVLTFRGDSDAAIVKGLVAIVISVFSGLSPKKILEIDAAEALEALELREHLTPQRSNGLNSMINTIKAAAKSASLPPS